MNTGRDRSSGWQYAKLSGHENELDAERLFDNADFKAAFSSRLGVGEIVSAKSGGLSESEVMSVFGDKTKSKTDLTLTLKDGQRINISIKKSAGGQVYLIGVERFIEGYERQFGRTVPDEVKRLLYIHFYGSPDTDTLLDSPQITRGQSASLVAYQRRHNRLVWNSLKNWGQDKCDTLLKWFRDNTPDIAEYCFSRGLAAENNDWAQYVWYINLLGEDSFDTIFSIEDIRNAAAAHPEEVYPGSQNGGSTVQLPFGFVQWHQRKMQFHHSLAKLSSIADRIL